jgi:tetratricopeptide (TPR) repeat protein
MASNPDHSSSNRSREPELLPNEREISYDAIHNFFARNKVAIVTLCFVLVFAAVALSVWRVQRDERINRSEVKLAEARSPEALEAVAREYSGTPAALLALLQLGGMYFDMQQWEKSSVAYQAILSQYRESSFAPSAAIGLAAILEAKGQNAEAVAAYRKAASDYPNAFQCPQALFSAARILEITGQLKEARQAYEDLASRFPNSPWKGESSGRLEKINSQLQKTAAIQAPVSSAPPALPKINVK